MPAPTGQTVTERVRIVLASEIRLYRDGLCGALGRIPSLVLAGGASTAEECLAMVRATRPDIVLVDTAMRGSRRTIERLAGPEFRTTVVALGVNEIPSDVVGWAETGITAFVTPAASLSDLVATLKGAARGEAICSPRSVATLIHRIAVLSAGRRAAERADRPLTGREREVADLLDEGLSNKEIARRLGIELATVKNHVHNILDKLRLHHRAEAASWVRRQRVLDPAD